jgi:hypothetical protein
MCKFFILGHCSKGVDCNFAHSKEELKALPDLKCTKVCKTLIQKGFCDVPGCTFAHSKDELRQITDGVRKFKSKICRFYTSDKGCSLGENCNFAHSSAELEAVIDQEAVIYQEAVIDQESEAHVQQRLFRPPPGLENENVLCTNLLDQLAQIRYVHLMPKDFAPVAMEVPSTRLGAYVMPRLISKISEE